VKKAVELTERQERFKRAAEEVAREIFREAMEQQRKLVKGLGLLQRDRLSESGVAAGTDESGRDRSRGGR